MREQRCDTCARAHTRPGIGRVIHNTRDIGDHGPRAGLRLPLRQRRGPLSLSLSLSLSRRPASFFFLAPDVPRGTLNLSVRRAHAISRGRGTSAIERATYPRALPLPLLRVP